MATTPEGFVIERCKTEECHASIVWARTNTGKLMPVDAEPVEGGNVRLYARQGIVRAEVVPPRAAPADLVAETGGGYGPISMPDESTPTPSEPLRTSHFVTCSRAADWRKPR